jgi:hypothetical protein
VGLSARFIRMNLTLLFLSMLLLLPLHAAAQELGTITVVEGALKVIRGTTVLLGTEGMRLHRGDIIENSGPGFTQLELVGGSILALGGSSRLFLFRYPAGTGGRNVVGETASELVLLSGWLKAETSSSSRTHNYASPLLAAATRDGTLVLHVIPEAAEVFVESGSARFGEISSDGSWRDTGHAKAGEFVSRRAGSSVMLEPRPTSIFTESMPRQFRDTLPARSSRFAGKATEPKRLHEVTYSEVRPWLTIGRTWREDFVERFRPRLKDAAFRKALEAHIDAYPEWDPILHPGRYEPKLPPAPDKPNPPTGRR